MYLSNRAYRIHVGSVPSLEQALLKTLISELTPHSHPKTQLHGPASRAWAWSANKGFTAGLCGKGLTCRRCRCGVLLTASRTLPGPQSPLRHRFPENQPVAQRWVPDRASGGLYQRR